MQIAENIKKLRKEHGWTQEQLAEALGVTVGAVYKWENKQSMPEIKLLVEMAEMFEISVDALLGYGWQSGHMGEAAMRIKAYAHERDMEKCHRYAEQSLKKYPNSFEVVYQSAAAYFHSMNPELAPRAIELYREAIRLIDQNPYDDVSLEMIENRIAMCYCVLGKVDDAIGLFKKNNIDGHNNCKIGLILAQCEGREEASLPYLSRALCSLHGNLQSICIGYAHAYRALGKLDQIRDLIHVLDDFGGGLREPNTVFYGDRVNVRILTVLAAAYMEREDRASALAYLKQAKQLAERFDAAPDYRAGQGKFYHGIENAMVFDDTGETAMDVIANYICKEKGGCVLKPIWEEICDEKE